jgi:hypothetical protein
VEEPPTRDIAASIGSGDARQHPVVVTRMRVGASGRVGSIGHQEGAQTLLWGEEPGMSTTPHEESGDGVAAHGYVRFTRGGEAALDALASRLAAEAGDSPEGLAQVLDRILRADIADLAGELARTTTDQNRRRTELATAQTPDQAARRRLGRHRDAPTGSTPPASRSLDP